VAVEHQLDQVEFGGGPAGDSDHDDAAPDGQRPHVGGDVGAADEFEDHVVGAAGREVLRGGHVRAEGGHGGAGVGVADGGGHPCAQQDGELDGGGAHAPGRAVHQQMIPPSRLCV